MEYATEAQDSRRDDVQDADNEEWVAINDLARGSDTKSKSRQVGQKDAALLVQRLISSQVVDLEQAHGSSPKDLKTTMSYVSAE